MYKRQVYSDANDARSRSWEFGEKLYIADGKALLCYDGTAVTLSLIHIFFRNAISSSFSQAR